MAAYGLDGIVSTHVQAAKAGYAWLAEAGESPVPLTIIAGYDVPTCLRVSRIDATSGFDFAGGTTPDGDDTVPLASATAVRGARRLYGRGLHHGNLPLYGVVRRAVRDLIHGDPVAGLETKPYSRPAVLGIEATEVGVPDQPVPGTLSEPQLDTIAERIRAGQSTPEDLRALASL